MSPRGMFVDTSICTGCKACQVACKEWNGLDPEPAHFTQAPGAPYPVATNFTGTSYDNTGRLGARNWRHVLFLEQINTRRAGSRWLLSVISHRLCFSSYSGSRPNHVSRLPSAASQIWSS